MSTAARNLYHDLTAIPWPFWAALVALSILAYLLAKWSEPFDPYATRSEQAEYRHAADISRLDALDFAARGELPIEERDFDWPTTCGHSNGALVCNRAWGHAGHHADFTAGRGEYGARWTIESIGDRSLDEIRRDFGGDAA